jgi:hypothetical protein
MHATSRLGATLSRRSRWSKAPVLCAAALAMAGGSLLATIQASPAAATSNPDTLIYLADSGNQDSQNGTPYLTDQNLCILDNGGEVTWGDFAPCQFTGATVDLSNGAVETFGATTTGTTAPGGVAVSRVEATGVNCTNTVGAIAIAPTADGNGFYIGDNNGDVYTYGDAASILSQSGGTIRIAGIAAEESTPNGPGGYLQVTPAGGVYAYGSAMFYGALSQPLNAPIVGIAVTPDDQGYWMVASDGGVFAFGDAKYYGSMGGTRLNQPIVGMAADDATGGYWLVASDGGVFSFNAPFYGSTGAIKLNKPIVGMEAAPNGSGYRFVASDGGVFCFNLPFEGSLGANPPSSPIAGMAPSGNDGYWLVEHNNTVQAFGTAPTFTQSG